MHYRHIAALAIVAALATPGSAAAQTWQDWSEIEARALVTAERGEVTEVVLSDDGDLEIHAIFDGWLHAILLGRDCNDRGGQRRCKELAFNALFEVDNASRSRELEAELNFNYVADMADGEDFVVERAVELGGGASLTNIRRQLDGFIRNCELVADAIWPSKTDGGKGRSG
ncbi:MAG: hypothetical protein REJ23_03170 [Brevundimonas sp.]|nr:hypothetical protein [Brevundimonas sp.]